MVFCLMPNKANEFLDRIKEGSLDPNKLAALTSKARRAEFAKFLSPDDAKDMNAAFESKLLLKNTQQGLISWIKQSSGLNKKQKITAIQKVKSLGDALTPENADMFLYDIVEKKFGFGVSVEEAKKISDLSKEVELKKKQYDDGKIDRIDYGLAIENFNEYVNDLKLQSEKIRLKDFASEPGPTTLKLLSKMAGGTKGLAAAADLSAMLRQGIKLGYVSPDLYVKNLIPTLIDTIKVLGGKNVEKIAKAELITRENALNGLYKDERLAIGTTEESYPDPWPSKIPVLGRIYKASDFNYKVLLWRFRADLFDKYVEIAKKSGGDIQGIGKVVNSLTGRASFSGKEQVANVVNNFMFSPRNLKANFDVLTAHVGSKDLSPFARKQAAKNLAKIVAGASTILAIAAMTDEDSVDWDPRSRFLGMIKAGNNAYDLTGGMSGVATLISRLASRAYGALTGTKIKRGGDYGHDNTGVMIYNYFANKASPAAAVVRDFGRDKTFSGEKPTIQHAITSLTTPIVARTVIEDALDKEGFTEDDLYRLVADFLGLSAKTIDYGKKKKSVYRENDSILERSKKKFEREKGLKKIF